MPPTDRPTPKGSEETSARVASLAARALADPESLTPDEVRSLAASALTQAPDRADGEPDGEADA